MVENPFAPGRYFVTPSVARKGTTHDFLDRQDRMVSVVVVGTFNTGARVQMEHEVDVERVSTAIGKEAQQ